MFLGLINMLYNNAQLLNVQMQLSNYQSVFWTGFCCGAIVVLLCYGLLFAMEYYSIWPKLMSLRCQCSCCKRQVKNSFFF